MEREGAETFCTCNYRALHHNKQPINTSPFFSEVPKLQLLWRKLSRLSCILYDRCLVSTGREARRVAGQTIAPPPTPITLGAQHTYIWPKYHYRRHHISSATCPPREYLLGTSPTLQILPSVRLPLQHLSAQGTKLKPKKTFPMTGSLEQRDKLWKKDDGPLPESRHYSPQKDESSTKGPSVLSQLRLRESFWLPRKRKTLHRGWKKGSSREYSKG